MLIQCLLLAVAFSLTRCCTVPEGILKPQELGCLKTGYMFADAHSLCFVWFCEGPGEEPIRRACPKGVRVPSWWTAGELNMCFIINSANNNNTIEFSCSRCGVNDPKPDNDRCASSPCPDDCICENVEHDHRCICSEIVEGSGDGSTAPLPKNHCEPNQCENGASCQNQWDGFFCFCPAGFTGHRCEIPVCDWATCYNGANCVVDDVGYHCECSECWTGACCNVTIPNCVTSDPCPACRTGLNCDQIINSCECIPPGNDLCGDGSECVNSPEGPKCETCDQPECYTQGCKIRKDTCECMRGSCPPNSRCENLLDLNSHECVCDECWEGPNCNIKSSSCACNNPCPATATCRDTKDGPMCDCQDCVSGDYCDKPIVSCDCNSPCADGEACKMENGSAVCYCEDSRCYFGAGCKQKRNNCECNNPCGEAEECYLDLHNRPVCRCINSCMTGTNCTELVQSCTCANPCQYGEQCIEAVDGPACESCNQVCRTGATCKDPIISCDCSNPCQSYEICTDSNEGPSCTCPSCTEGYLCDLVVSSCACNNSCSENGRCHESITGPVCRCDPCWTGPTCSERKETCECENDCLPFEQCFNDGNGHYCGCPSCYTGSDCSVYEQSCECANPCKPEDICDDSSGTPVCQCKCLGSEECFEDTLTGIQECRCPACYKNKIGERGCPSRVENTCDCNNPCTADEVCTESDDPDSSPVCRGFNPTAGTSFTVMFEENNTEKSMEGINLELYFASAGWSDGNRTVRVSTPGLPPTYFCYVDDTIVVEENTVARYPLGKCLRQNGTGLHTLAIRVEEIDNKTISVYGINKDRWTADAFLALPDEQGGQEFQTSSFSPAHIATQFAIVSLYDDTEVTIKLSDDNNLPAPYNKKGSVYNITLRAFNTFQVQARCPGHTPSLTSECELDLTGTEIISNKKIHVFSGNVRAFVPDVMGRSRDHLVEQLMPRDRWGTDFAFMSIPGRVIGDIIQIMAIAGQATLCHLYKRPCTAQGLDEPMEPVEYRLPYRGRYSRNVDVPSSHFYRLKCDKQVFVTQISKSRDLIYQFQNETVHDPATITVPAITQFTNNYVLITPQYTGGRNFDPKPYNTTLALLIAEKGEETTITLNEQPLDDSSFVVSWRDVPKSKDPRDHNLVAAALNIPHGTNIIKTTDGHNFQCLIYGYDDRESYGMPAGMALSKFRG